MKKVIIVLIFIFKIHLMSYGQVNERKTGLTFGLEYRYLAFTSGKMYSEGWYDSSLYSDAKGMSLRFYLGYFITKNINLNAGFGLDGYQNPDSNTAPLVLQVKYYLNNGLKDFYAFVEGGTLLALSQARTFDVGKTYGTGIGKTFKLSKFLKLSTSIGYCYQNSSDESFGSEYTRNSMIFGIGLFY